MPIQLCDTPHEHWEKELIRLFWPSVLPPWLDEKERYDRTNTTVLCRDRSYSWCTWVDAPSRCTYKVASKCWLTFDFFRSVANWRLEIVNGEENESFLPLPPAQPTAHGHDAGGTNSFACRHHDLARYHGMTESWCVQARPWPCLFKPFADTLGRLLT